jgi:hypothetical protein
MPVALAQAELNRRPDQSVRQVDPAPVQAVDQLPVTVDRLPAPQAAAEAVLLEPAAAPPVEHQAAAAVRHKREKWIEEVPGVNRRGFFWQLLKGRARVASA